MELCVPLRLKKNTLMFAALIFVDESVQRILVPERKWNSADAAASNPFQRGYQDFLPFAMTEEAIQTKEPPRSSIYDDL